MYTGKIGRGQHVRDRSGNAGIVMAVHGEQHPETVKTLLGGVMLTGGGAVLDIVFGHFYCKMLPESVVRHWTILEDVATEAEIVEAVIVAETALEKARLEKVEEERKLKELREQLPAQYPYLETTAGGEKSRVLASRNIKKELAHTFPGQKFSVKSRSYSGGNSIDVSWDDGPTKVEVEVIVSKYEEGHFNGMEDIYEYSDSPFPDVFGGSKYVFAQRRVGFERHVEIAKSEFGLNVRYDDYRMIDAVTGAEIERDIIRRVGDAVDNKSFYVRPEHPVVETDVVVEGVVVRKNEEKNGIEILFGTKPSDEVLDAVRDHGFRFSFHNGKIWWAKFTEEKWAFAQSFIPKGA